MKRILTLALALGLCGLANAASVNWSVAGKSFSTSDGANARAADYFVAVFLYSDYDVVLTGLKSGDATAVDSAVASYIQNSNTTGKTGGTDGSFTTTSPSGTTLQLFTVAFDAKTIKDASNYIMSVAVDSDAYEAPATPTNQGAFTADSYSSSSWTKMEAVPEPSVALMGLLGIGMLLKRRKA